MTDRRTTNSIKAERSQVLKAVVVYMLRKTSGRIDEFHLQVGFCQDSNTNQIRH